MKQFKDISSFCKLLGDIFKAISGEYGRKYFATLLEQYFEFTKEQSDFFSGIVLSRNSKDSAEFVEENAWKMVGSWKHLNQHGSPSAYMSTTTESWRFHSNLTYEHQYETYKGYMNPFGFSYSDLKKSDPEIGLWAPSDRLENVFKLALIDSKGQTRELEVERLDNSCKINYNHFILD